VLSEELEPQATSSGKTVRSVATHTSFRTRRCGKFKFFICVIHDSECQRVVRISLTVRFCVAYLARLSDRVRRILRRKVGEFTIRFGFAKWFQLATFYSCEQASEIGLIVEAK
jgi:hypothetical protein